LGAAIAIGILFVLLGIFADMEEAVKGRGQFTPSRAIYAIQPPEGGIFQAILVRDGALVEPGSVLVRLTNAAIEADLQQSRSRLAGLNGRRARLRAFLNDTAPDFSAIGPAYGDIVQDQMALLRGQQLARQTSLWVIDSQIQQKKSEIAITTQQVLNTERLAGVDGTLLSMREDLARRNLVSKTMRIETERRYVTTAGEVLRLGYSLGKLEAALSEVVAKRQALATELHHQANNELGTVLNDLSQEQHLIGRLEDRCNQLVVRAPVRGWVQDLRAKTVGGVLRPGDTILQIVPADDELNLEIHISPQDIGFVSPGQDADIKVASYDPERYGTVSGKLISISPFTLLDKDKNVFYRGLIRPARNYLGNNALESPIRPGMGAEVSVITGHRSLLIYIIKPLISNLARLPKTPSS
jgi:HlyD family type I secretion membrane fusion protein